VSVSELAEQFGVSAVTIRSDLSHLERQGLLIRTHGGAMTGTDTRLEPAFAVRQRLSVEEKHRIGQAAAALVHDGDAIALDASTTSWHVARQLKDRRELTVVTNCLQIALEFLDAPHITVVMPGGTFRAASASLVGAQGIGLLETYHLQKGFFGARGFTLEEGLTDVNQYEVELKRSMVERAKKVIAVVDATKWGQVAFASFASLDQLDRVITDTAAPANMVAALRERKIEVVLT
jgi:DeoR/GlpR family transcriptional regulator of sugar metabolism